MGEKSPPSEGKRSTKRSKETFKAMGYGWNKVKNKAGGDECYDGDCNNAELLHGLAPRGFDQAILKRDTEPCIAREAS